MNPEVSRQLLLNGIRWTSNILIELLSCYAANISDDGRNHLRNAVTSLGEAQTAFQKAT